MNVNKLLIFSLVLSMSYQASAQTGLSDELRDDLLGEYQEQPLSDEVNGELVEVSDVPIASPGQQVRFQQPQQQPTTYVEAEPLTDSKAERIRKLRQRAEINTEEKIVEKLESSRLKDEQKRAEKLFGNRLEDQAQQQPVQQQPQQQMVQVVPVEDKTSERDREDLRSEILDAVREEINVSKEEEMIEAVEPAGDKYYMSVLVGTADYADDNSFIKADNSLGVGFGVEMPDGLIFEGAYSRSQFTLDDYYYLTTMDQHNVFVALKYGFLNTMRVRPNVGVIASYTIRDYSDQSYRYSYTTDRDSKTKAFDVGLSAGVDAQLSERFAIGVEFKYFTNFTREGSDNYAYNYYRSSYRPTSNQEILRDNIEQQDYYIFGVSGRIRF